MKKRYKVLLSACAFAVGFAAVALLGNQVLTPVAAKNFTKIDNQAEMKDMFVKPDYPVNENGDTYGVIVNVMPEDYPDFIKVIATNGKEGYAREEDFNDAYIPKSP